MREEIENELIEVNSVINLNSNKYLQQKLWNNSFILIVQGQLVSILGDNIYDIALRFWIFEKTGSTSIMGVLMALTILPKIIISPFAGTFVDRYDRKKVLIITDIIRGITILFIGILAITGFIQVWMILIVGIIVGICGCFFNPAINSTIPDIVPKSKLLNANSILSSISTGNDMAGNAFGGFLIQVLGAPIIFILNGISFLFSAVTECFVKIPKIELPSEKVSFWQDLKSGAQFIRNSKGLKYLYITISFLNFVASMSITLTLPWFKVNNQLGIELYGIAMAINSFGMLIGFTCLSMIKLKKEKRFYAFIASGIITGITMIIYSISLNFYIIAIMFFINGFCIAVTNSLIQLSMQNSVPSGIRSKVFAFRNTLVSTLMPLGMVLAGILAENIKMNIIIFTDYTIYLMLFIYLLSISSVKEIINT